MLRVTRIVFDRGLLNLGGGEKTSARQTPRAGLSP